MNHYIEKAADNGAEEGDEDARQPKRQTQQPLNQQKTCG
jgi:hypothetical protein